jgi:hypothetical protein
MAGENQESSGKTATKLTNQGSVNSHLTHISTPKNPGNISEFPQDFSPTLSDEEMLQHRDAIQHPNPALQKNRPKSLNEFLKKKTS